MEIILGKYNGFCAGVKRAVDTALKIGKEGVFILGELIHNESVVEQIKSLGVKVITSPDEIFEGTLIIRSHGVGKAVYEKLKQKNIKIVDCTCPYVKKIHEIVEKYSEQGYKIVIVGERNHPEVIGIAGWSHDEAIIVKEISDAPDFDKYEKICIVAQTTCSKANFTKFLNFFNKLYAKTVEIFETICYTTMERQQEAAALSNKCDAMIVIGGSKSSNTEKLYRIAKENCPNTVMIPDASKLDVNKFVNFKKVGIVSGASTPREQAVEVFSKMEEVTEVKTLNEMEEAVAKLDATQTKFRRGQKIVATISSATDEGLALYINNTKKEILLPKEEIDCEKYAKEDFAAKVGEEIEVLIIGLTPVQLSQKAIARLAEEEKEISEIKDGKVFNVVVDGINKGGLTAKFANYGVFIPSSQIRIGFVKDLEKYVGKTLRVKAEKIETTERRKQIVASQRVVLQAEKDQRDAERAEKEERFFANVRVGDVVKGTVVRFAAFGAFVEVDGFDCLAHISDLSWSGVKNPGDVLEIGQEYEFKVLKADSETKKVSIGYKQLQARPWDNVPSKYSVGDIITGKIVRIVDFGVFVEIEPGVDGLVHISQISHEWLENPTEGLKVGEEVTAKIIIIDAEKEKITLSIKATIPAPEMSAQPKRRERNDNNNGYSNNNDGEERPRRKQRRDRNNYGDDEGDFKEWKESDFSGASIAELINKN